MDDLLPLPQPLPSSVVCGPDSAAGVGALRSARAALCIAMAGPVTAAAAAAATYATELDACSLPCSGVTWRFEDRTFCSLELRTERAMLRALRAALEMRAAAGEARDERCARLAEARRHAFAAAATPLGVRWRSGFSARAEVLELLLHAEYLAEGTRQFPGAWRSIFARARGCAARLQAVADPRGAEAALAVSREALGRALSAWAEDRYSDAQFGPAAAYARLAAKYLPEFTERSNQLAAIAADRRLPAPALDEASALAAMPPERTLPALF